MADDFVVTNPVASGFVGAASQFDAVWNNTLALRLRIPRGLARGLHLGTAKASDMLSKVTLLEADEITMSDGARVTDWRNLSADITVSGAGGLDTGSEISATWYEIHAIQRSSDGNKSLLLHRARQILLDESQLTGGAALTLTGNTQRAAQGFQVDLTSPVYCVDCHIGWGTAQPAGYAYLTINTNSSGVPSATVLATSDAIDLSMHAPASWVRFYFRSLPALVVGTQYHLVLQCPSATVNAGQTLVWTASASSLYARGTAATYNGSSWTADAAKDACFELRHMVPSPALTLPAGYDRSALIGHVYNTASANFLPFRQHDRDVAMPLTLLGTTTASTPLRVDCSAALPPVPVLGRFVVGHSLASNWVAISPSDRPLNAAAAGAVVGYCALAGSLVETYVEQLVEGQSAYAFSSTPGSGTVWAVGYRW